MSRSQRLAFAVIAALIAVVAVVVFASGGDDEPPATTTTQAAEQTATATSEPEEAEPRETPTPEPTPEATEIEVEAGEVRGGAQEIRAEQGDTIRFTVTSDVPEEVHLHGYDVSKSVAPGKPARFTVKADIVGIFEVELEGSHVQVASLRVEQ